MCYKSSCLPIATLICNAEGLATTHHPLLLLVTLYVLHLFNLNVAGIPRMSSVTIFQPDHFVLSTIYYSNVTFRSP